MIHITDDIGVVVQAMRNSGSFVKYNESVFTGIGTPYYMFGHRVEIASRLSQKEIDPIKKKKKYPLIALKLDIAENVNGDVSDFSLNIVIATVSNPNLNAEERIEKTFKPILYPLYSDFLIKIRDSGLFFWYSELDQIYPPHIKIDRPYWGTEAKEGNVKNIFNDVIDAIEIVNLKVSRKNSFCTI